jgi:hypothetical protein
MKKCFLGFIVFMFCCFSVFSQRKTIKDSIYRIPITGLQMSFQLPEGDMAQRFGPSINVGLPFYYKTRKNIIIGFEANYFFSSNVKEKTMSNLYNSDGFITNINGNPATYRLNERGWDAYAVLGGVLNKYGNNKNSGIMMWAGLGYMQHKINIYDVGNNMPQIAGNLVKGYDRLTGGLAVSQFIGYLYISKNRLSNFYAGLEFQEGFTTGLRGYQYDLMAPDNKKRLDILMGIRIGWLLPLYKKLPKEFYYF